MAEVVDDETLALIENDPILALQVLMPGFALPPHQEVMLVDFWRAEFCYSTSSRSTGKSALSGAALLLWCILRPGTKAGILAQKFSSAKLVMEFVETLIKKYPLLQKCVVPTKTNDFCLHGSDRWIITFTNGSTLVALPSDIAKRGARVRGYRFNLLLVDEAWTIPYSIVTQVFIPCCSIRDKQGFRKLVFTTTGGTKPSEHWDLCVKHFRETIKGNPKYAFWNFTYQDVPEEFSFIVDREALADLEANSDAGTVARELYGLWTEAGGSYYSGHMLERNRLLAIDREVFTEDSGVPGGVYVIGIDPAFRGTDHTAIAVLRKFEEGHWGVVASHSVNFKKSWAEKNALLLLDYIERFQPAYIALDRNGGEQLLRELLNYYSHSPDTCPIAMDAEVWERGNRICRQFVPTGTGKDNNTRLNTRLLRALDNGTLLLPGAVPEQVDENGNVIDGFDGGSLAGVDKLQQQLLSITTTPIDSQPGLFKFSSGVKKDRYSALLYAWNAAEELVDGESDFAGSASVEPSSCYVVGTL